MAEATTAQKIKFAKTHYKKGVEAPSELQALVRKKFGKGLRFIDMARVYPASKRKASAAKRQKKAASAATAAKPGRARRGRPPASAKDSIVLMIGDEAETFSGRRKLEARVAELIAEGRSTADLSVYEKTSMRLSIRNTVNL